MQVGSSKVQMYTKGVETKTSILELVVIVVNPMLSKNFQLGHKCKSLRSIGNNWIDLTFMTTNSQMEKTTISTRHWSSRDCSLQYLNIGNGIQLNLPSHYKLAQPTHKFIVG
jgi:hypothetical protein